MGAAHASGAVRPSRRSGRSTRLGYDVETEGPPSAGSAPARRVDSIDIERLARSVRVPRGRLVMSSVTVDQPPTAGERKAREVAEAARERQWTRPSFAKGLYLGAFDVGLIH